MLSLPDVWETEEAVSDQAHRNCKYSFGINLAIVAFNLKDNVPSPEMSNPPAMPVMLFCCKVAGLECSFFARECFCAESVDANAKGISVKAGHVSR